jgi:hypothetical protein
MCVLVSVNLVYMNKVPILLLFRAVDEFLARTSPWIKILLNKDNIIVTLHALALALHCITQYFRNPLCSRIVHIALLSATILFFVDSQDFASTYKLKVYSII